MMKHKIVIGFLSLFLVSATFAATSSRWQISPSAGYLYFAHRQHLKATTLPALLIDYQLSNGFSAQLLLGAFSTRYDGHYARRHVHGSLGALNLVYHFRETKSFRPYLLAGMGKIHMNPQLTFSPVTQADLNAGFGFQYQMSKYVGIHLDVRNIYIPSGGKSMVMGTAGVDVFL